MEMLKQDKKDIVSGAIVKMPQTFLKPYDYSSELLLRSDQHPTLRQYLAQPLTSSTEVDPQFALFPYQRTRPEPLDEISMKKQSVAKEIKASAGAMPVSQTYSLGTTKTAGGSHIRSLDVPTTLMPGNFGCRVIDGVMPTNFSVVFKQRRSTLTQNFVCDNSQQKVPVLLDLPIQTDYLTDEESDDGAGFKLKVPKLSDLLNEFEVGDDCLIGKETDFKNYQADLKTRGMPRTLRDNI